MSLSPTTVYTNDTLTATATTADADGDPLTVTYDWYVDGRRVQSGATATLSGAASFDRDEVVYVEATVDDGTDTASATSSSVTVSNTAPTAPVVEITPVDAGSGDDLTCSVVTESTDADGDGLTYGFAWDVDGVDYTGAADSATQSIVDGASVGGGETWTCEVDVQDGASSTVTDTTLTTQEDPCSYTVSMSAGGVEIHSAEFLLSSPPTALQPMVYVASTAQFTWSNATIDNAAILDDDGAVLMTESFATSTAWTPYKGTIASGRGNFTMDWGYIYSNSTVTSTNGISFSVDVTWTSATDSVTLMLTDGRVTWANLGNGFSGTVCRGVNAAWGCSTGSRVTVAAYDWGTLTSDSDYIARPSGIPTIGTSQTFTLTASPSGGCW